MEQTIHQKHYSTIRKILIWILFLNWAVAAAKLIYGIFTRCESMTADGFHSLSDGASNIIGLFGIHFACQPRDKDHPYGHRKYETLFSLGISAMLFLLAFNLAKESISRLHHPSTPQVDILSFLIMIITMTINFLVMRYERKQGVILKSDFLISDAMHTKADILTSASVIITLIVIKLGFPILDPIATIFISLFIAHAGFDIMRDASKVLCDTAAFLDPDRITKIVLKIRGVKACHKIRNRGRPDEIYLDLHVQVDPTMPIGEAHKISYTIEEAIKKEIPEISDVIVHIEPQES